jgi:hypothetical protein
MEPAPTRRGQGIGGLSMTLNFSWLALGAAVLAVAPAASAATYVATYAGTVSSGMDASGTFGTPVIGTTADLTGDAATIVLTFDSSQAVSVSPNDIHGGLQYGGGTFGGGVLTIGAHDLLVDGQLKGFIGLTSTQLNTEVDFGQLVLGASTVTSEIDAILSTGSAALPSKLAPFSYTAQPGDTVEVFFRANGHPGNAQLSLANVTLTVSGVPEPASWAMMLLGVGLLGVLARRRREAAPRSV